MRKGGAGKRRDAIEPDVLEHLRARGVQCWQLNGYNTPDVLTLYRGRWLPMGVKSGEKSRLTAAERAGKAPWPLVRSVEDAIRTVVTLPQDGL